MVSDDHAHAGVYGGHLHGRAAGLTALPEAVDAEVRSVGAADTASLGLVPGAEQAMKMDFSLLTSCETTGDATREHGHSYR